MRIIHKDIWESGKWFKLSIFEQMANVGADVDRAVRWKKRGDIEASNAAFERALELIDFTKMDPRNKKRLKELCRMREVLIDYFMFDNEYQCTDEQWYNYFYDFNYAAAIAKGK
jgi:hypothetical protein